MTFYVVKSNCEICGCEETSGNRLVRDHNHRTGMIRGTLCDGCNSRVGIYESSAYKWRARQFKKAKHRWWLEKFEALVIKFLKQDTGIPYGNPHKEVVIREKDLRRFQEELLDRAIQKLQEAS